MVNNLFIFSSHILKPMRNKMDYTEFSDLSLSVRRKGWLVESMRKKRKEWVNWKKSKGNKKLCIQLITAPYSARCCNVEALRINIPNKLLMLLSSAFLFSFLSLYEMIEH